MANAQHIAWVLEGVESWNRRREADDSIMPNFAKANLHAEFAKAGKLDAEGYIPLDGANLEYADFRSAILQNPNLDGATGPLQGTVSLQNANLHMARFERAQLENARLNRADMTGAIFEKAHLEGAFFVDARLRSAYLSSAFVAHADFTGADLSGADLSNATLWDARLDGALLAASEPWKAHFYSSPELRSAMQFNDLGFDDAAPCNIEHVLGSIRSLKHRYAQHQGERPELSAIPIYGRVGFYYRGHAKSKWHLKPSVMREEKTRIKESAMLVELNARRPEEIGQANSALAQWVLAQHHGLPTRFLDVTKNPLVALFHACGQHPDEDGLLHIFAAPQDLVQRFNSDTVRVIANFARLEWGEQVALLGIREIPAGNFRPSDYRPAMNRLSEMMRKEKPYFEDHVDVRTLLGVFVVEPQQSTERIRAQSGAFLLSAFHERFEREEVLKIHRQEGGPPLGQGIPIYAHYTITVPSRAKPGIMSDLEMLNVTGESLFPGLDSSAAAVKNLFLGADC